MQYKWLFRLRLKGAGSSASASTDLIEVESFFTTVIVPELENQNVNEFPMVKAAAHKFFTMFRNQIPNGVALELFPDVVRFLSSESNVVHLMLQVALTSSCL